MKDVQIERPQRWHRPFSPEMSEADVDRALAAPVFSGIDPAPFPANLSLHGIIRNDARLVRLQRGDIVVREGDYGSSVFVILAGSVRVVLDAEALTRIGQRPARRHGSWRHAFRQIWSRPRLPEVRDVRRYQQTGIELRGEGSEARTFLRDVDGFLESYPTVTLAAGEMFGEIAALSRSPRTATVFADCETELVELRWQGLREIRRRDPRFREQIDDLYRSRDLTNHLADIPLLSCLDDETLREVAAQTRFESYGDLEWFSSFKQVAAHDPIDLVEREPLIVEEGHHADDLLIIRSGFARISQRLDYGHRTVGYLTAGEPFGLEEIVRHWRHGGELRRERSLRAVGYVDLLRVPARLIEEQVLEEVAAHLLPEVGERPLPSVPAWAGRAGSDQLEQSLLDATVDRRVINGTATMLIDGNRCIGCDDCVAACAATHEGNPRFVRHGSTHANLMFVNACMHCVDPVCLIGCPTGAIHRPADGTRVLIEDVTCIGCGVCADSCPYSNIRMVEIRDRTGAMVTDSESGIPIVKATKCDLCEGQLGGPACERACPHDALIRIDMRDRSRLAAWVSRSRHRLRRALTATVTVASAALVAWIDILYERSLRPLNQLSGWVLVTALAVLLLLWIRKRLPTLPLGRVATWTRVHAALGTVAAVVFALHAGLSPPTGVLETALWWVFVLVAMSGIIGLALSRQLPPRLIRRGEQVLVQRIAGFRRQLAERVEELVMASVRETATSTIADYYAHRLHRFFAGPRNLIGHIFQSNRGVSRLQAEMTHLKRYLDDRGQEIASEIEGCLVAKDNLDFHLAHGLALRAWRLVHLPLTYSLLMLIAMHVVMVSAFSAGAL
jgi:Fe-S-cluster-containing dehydrogenase component/CRP-like cAMP-binding protein